MAEKIKGKGVISGIAVGNILLAGQNLDSFLVAYKPRSKGTEKKKAAEALVAVAENLKKSIEEFTAQGLKEQAGILEAHRLLVEDPSISSAVDEQIDISGSAPKAVLDAYEANAQIFEQMDDEYFRGRAVDMRDVGKRIAKYLLGIKEPEIAGKVIVAGKDIEPSVIAGLPTDKIAGVILGVGSTTAHAVIIAKTRAIPTVVGVGDGIIHIADGDPVILDGETGEILIRPSDEEREAYNEKIKEQEKLRAHYAELKDKPAITIDGKEVELVANIGSPADADAAVKNFGATGVGLFRSEFVFMGKTDVPKEEDQFKEYKAAVEYCASVTHGEGLCVIRTMDIGGDKPLPYIQVGHEENPFLGYRAIRISLRRKDLFLPQLKAILRAGVYGKAAIMFPMVINVDEFLAAKQFVEEAKRELAAEGQKYSDNVQVGIMVETPAAAVMAPVLAKYVDFFSIGTNDLVQYTLAVDRGNAQISYLYNHFNPAVLRLIKRTIESANKEGKWAGMCGEMASDPNAAIILMAMGIKELSMSAPSIPKVKERIRNITFTKAKEILDKVMELEDGDKIRDYLATIG
ncbi:MAG: phosphoenolpyruvate--protein phosphotransferase [Selenomonadaceae bacterium]|nr:phosphoenolpyruvate--protein phosphotransferase [Selenomonadaceae bacterium]MBR0102533.1 phosphoenolpyruvate--protein phosphotransferase [Selenomonadaceae bacterium]MBR6713657.1 phosphoenolpyruvate--protein phosphotransferase [Selenomonadaceae bacterium]